MVRSFLFAVALLVFSSAASAQQFVGQANGAWSADSERCVPDVIGRMNAMRARGDDLAFHLGTVSRGQKTSFFGLVDGAHWQGIQRLKGGSGKYLAVSQSYDPAGLGGVAIVEMGSRNSINARFRSNRLSYASIEQTVPPYTDRGVGYFQTISSVTGHVYGHAGGMQAVGNYLLVPAESKVSGANPSVNSELLFYDVSNPLMPLQLPYSIQRADAKAGTTAIARIADGRYIVLVEGGGKLDFYVSSGVSLADASNQFTMIATWTMAGQGFLPGSVDQNFGNYQSYGFVVQCDGKLFLTASNNSLATAGVLSGEDWLDLYEVNLYAGYPTAALRKVVKRHLYCADAAARTCNFAAGGGTYITLDGDISFYSTEHFNDGPAGSVSFSEFVTEPNSCSSINDAWVELFDDHGFLDRTVFVDFADRFLRRYDNYNYLEGFNDKASSVRYCLPYGNNYVLYSNNSYGGTPYTLYGYGSVGSVYNLGTVGFGDKLSSSRFVP